MNRGENSHKAEVEILPEERWPADPGPPPLLIRSGRAGHLTKESQRAAQAWVARCYAAGASLTRAAHSAGLARATVQNWIAEDPAFGALWEEADQVRADRLEEEAWNRATEGYDNGKVLVKSDALLKVMLAGARPEKYGQRAEVHVTGGITLTPGLLSQTRDAGDDETVEAAALRLLDARRSEGGEA